MRTKLLGLGILLCTTINLVLAQETELPSDYKQSLKNARLAQLCESLRIYHVGEYSLKFSFNGETWTDSLATGKGYFEVTPQFDFIYDGATQSYILPNMSYSTYANANALAFHIQGKGIFENTRIDGDCDSSIPGITPRYTQKDGYETLELTATEDVPLYPTHLESKYKSNLATTLTLKAGSRISFTTRIPKIIHKPWDTGACNTGDIIYSSGTVDYSKRRKK